MPEFRMQAVENTHPYRPYITNVSPPCPMFKIWGCEKELRRAKRSCCTSSKLVPRPSTIMLVKCKDAKIVHLDADTKTGCQTSERISRIGLELPVTEQPCFRVCRSQKPVVQNVGVQLRTPKQPNRPQRNPFGNLRLCGRLNLAPPLTREKPSGRFNVEPLEFAARKEWHGSERMCTSSAVLFATCEPSPGGIRL